MIQRVGPLVNEGEEDLFLSGGLAIYASKDFQPLILSREFIPSTRSVGNSWHGSEDQCGCAPALHLDATCNRPFSAMESKVLQLVAD